MADIQIKSKSANQTKKIAETLVENIFKENKDRKTALILAMEGDLGGGKTTFLQGVAKALGIKERVLSPTFLIMKKFEIPCTGGKNKEEILFKNFFHFDCYRISLQKELFDLGWKNLISDPKNIIAIEWAERIKNIPKNAIKIKFDFINENSRLITFFNYADRKKINNN